MYSFASVEDFLPTVECVDMIFVLLIIMGTLRINVVLALEIGLIVPRHSLVLGATKANA